VREAIRLIFRPHVGHVTLLTAVALALVGISAISTAPTADWYGPVAMKQAVFLAAGVVVCLLVALPHHRHVCNLAYAMALVTIPLLVVLLLPGVPEFLVPMRNGARRWIDVGVILFQPSEVAKVVYVLALARYLRYRENYRSIWGLAVPMILTCVPVGLILVEPDLGTSLVFVPVLLAMLVAAGAKLGHMAAMGLVAGVLAAGVVTVEFVVWPPIHQQLHPGEPNRGLLLRPHQRARLIALAAQVQGDTEHRETVGFQGYKAMTAVGAGQLTGYGKERAEYILDMNDLPEPHTDMIFAVICARWGLAGGVAVVMLYLLLLGSALMAAALNRDPFARLMVVGLSTAIFVQVFVNIGMTIGLLPITGLTLPLVSYGGSSLLITFVMIGLIVNAAARRPTMMTRPAFEFRGTEQVSR
jgi:cell division protein FtsW (lipid II flippase)